MTPTPGSLPPSWRLFLVRAEQLLLHGKAGAGVPRLVGAAALVVGKAHRAGRDRIDRRQKPDVQVGHAGVPGIAAAADDVTAPNPGAGRQRDRVSGEMAKLGVLAGRVLD